MHKTAQTYEHLVTVCLLDQLTIYYTSPPTPSLIKQYFRTCCWSQVIGQNGARAPSPVTLDFKQGIGPAPGATRHNKSKSVTHNVAMVREQGPHLTSFRN